MSIPGIININADVFIIWEGLTFSSVRGLASSVQAVRTGVSLTQGTQM